ncbi:hypothetical protein [Escherichia coli]|uniref:hypothetical protein n=1 Tax=Escherichia coli TaxID=562 RepID=UPI0023B89F6C|nr:hypothetical protein [Escherichia coli]MCL9902369.1 hypothetical protein [Escherichia coli]
MPAFEWVHVQLHQQKGMISLSPPTICNSAQKGTLVGGHDDNDSSLDISYMSNGNNIDYGGDKVFAGNYRSDYLWYAILGGTNSRAKAELNGAFFNITRPRNIAFNYIVRAA